MSTKRDRKHLKTYFETGDRPTEGEFIEFIDSIIVQNADHIWVDADSDAKNVGIGTEFPQKKLHVNGNTQLDGDTHVKGLITVGGDIYGDKSTKDDDKDLLIVRNGGEIQFFGKRYPGRQGDLFLIGDKSDNGSGKIVFSQLLGPSAWRNNMAIDTHGNVGIGTENPQDALQIGTGLAKLDFGSAYGPNTGWGGGYIGFNTARNNGSWTTESDGGNNGAAVIYSDVSGGLNFVTLATNDPSAGGQTRSDQDLRNNIKLKIRNDGNVGIGTTNPESKLHIHHENPDNTGLRLTGQSTWAPGQILVADTDGTAKWADGASAVTSLWQINGNHIHNGNSGNVGIGVTNPTQKLHVDGEIKTTGGVSGNNGLTLFSDGQNGGLIQIDETAGISFHAKGTTNNMFKFYQMNSNGSNVRQPFTINQDGNVGIGVVNPLEKLHVNGNVRLSGHVQWNNSNGRLTIEKSDSTGAYIEMFDESNAIQNSDTNNGGISFIARGSNNHNMHRFLHNNSGYFKESLRLTSDGNADFGGNLLVNSKKPILVRRFMNLGDISGGVQLKDSNGSAYSTIDYAAAAIIGFSTTPTNTQFDNKFQIAAYTEIRNNLWYAVADFTSVIDPFQQNQHEGWTLTVMFIRTEISEWI